MMMMMKTMLMIVFRHPCRVSGFVVVMLVVIAVFSMLLQNDEK
jgi:hypothetical protein